MSQSSEDLASAENIRKIRSHSLGGLHPENSRPHRDSVLLTEEQYVVEYLGDSSGSDDEMSIEAKRITRRKKLEREKLQKLGSFTVNLHWMLETDRCHCTLNCHQH